MKPPTIGDPTVSVLINNFNYERFIGAAIDSALSQTYPFVQVIVVDDGSEDGSRAVIERYDRKVRPVFQPNRGQAAAFNAGFAASSGDIVMFLDADDVLLPQACERLVEMFADPAVAKAHWCLSEIDEHGSLTGGIKPERFPPEGDLREITISHGPLSTTSPPTSGLAFSRNALDAVLPMPEEPYRICADAHLALMTGIEGTTKRSLEPLSCWRRHSSNNYNNADKTLQARLEEDMARYLVLSADLKRRLDEQGLVVDPTIWRTRTGVYRRWERLSRSLEAIAASVPEGRSFVLFDDWDWDQDGSGRPLLPGRTPIRPFASERNSATPPEEDALIAELRRILYGGAAHVAFVWPGTWWLDHYPRLRGFLRECGGVESDRAGVKLFEIAERVGPDARDALAAGLRAREARLRTELEARRDGLEHKRRQAAFVMHRRQLREMVSAVVPFDSVIAVLGDDDTGGLELPVRDVVPFAHTDVAALRASEIDYVVVAPGLGDGLAEHGRLLRRLGLQDVEAAANNGAVIALSVAADPAGARAAGNGQARFDTAGRAVAPSAVRR